MLFHENVFNAHQMCPDICILSTSIALSRLKGFQPVSKYIESLGAIFV